MVIQTPIAPKDKSIPEWYTPITPKLLRQITQRIVEEFQPERIVLFGSYAYGKPTIHSDLDILVISNRMRNKSVIHRDRCVAEIAHAALVTGQSIGMDILVRSPSELAHRLRIGDPFFRTVALKGTVLYRREGSRFHFDTKKWRNRMPEPILIEEWIQHAEEDYEAALDLLRRRKHPMPAMVCYHCQQCAEKYLKAFLLDNNNIFEKIHNLLDLNESCQKIDASFGFVVDWLKVLNPYAIETRYPGRRFELAEAKEAVVLMKEVRKFIRAKLGLR